MCLQATTKSAQVVMAEAKELLSIHDFYAKKTIFITGATGFLGKIVIEKLLRDCPLVKKLFLLTRSRRGVNPQQRIDNILDSGVSRAGYSYSCFTKLLVDAMIIFSSYLSCLFLEYSAVTNKRT